VAEELDPNQKRRLQAWFTKGTQCAAKGDNNYAAEMFAQCTLGDPNNRLYVENLIGALRNIYNNNGKGASMSGMRTAGMKANIKKSKLSKAWKDVLKQGIEVLKLNPWDAGMLTDMAEACEKLEATDGRIGFYDAAWTADPKDYDINFNYGQALVDAEQYEKATVCFQRAAKVKPDQPEARRMVSWCSAKVAELDFGEHDTTQDAKVKGQGGSDLSPKEALLKKLRKEPDNAGAYMELAEIYSGEEKYDEAEKTMAKALEVSGGDMGIRESLEDTKLMIFRNRVNSFLSEVKQDPSPAKKEEYKRLRIELVKRELEHYRTRAERYPNNTHYQFELGRNLKITRQYKEAIAAFQIAKSDVSRRAETMLELGDCFRQIKQNQLALSHYVQGIEAESDDHSDHMKKLLYSAGSMAIEMGEKAKAKEYLHRLAGLDFAYQDVSELLDKLSQEDDTA
jgi:tetratricopeptide (TPR) repeat protein